MESLLSQHKQEFPPLQGVMRLECSPNTANATYRPHMQRVGGLMQQNRRVTWSIRSNLHHDHGWAIPLGKGENGEFSTVAE